MRTIRNLSTWIACIAIVCFGYWLWSAFASQHTLFSTEIGHGHSIRIWSEEDWDHTLPLVYYEINSPHRTVVPPTFVSVQRIDRNQTFEFERISTARHDLVAIHAIDRETRKSCSVIVFDFASGESWPRNCHYDERGNAMGNKWASRFEKIKKMNPEFPIP